MTKIRMNVVALAIGLAFSSAAMAQTMTDEQYKSGKDRIAADAKAGKAACKSLSGNANDICNAEASGGEDVAKAELDARHKPSGNATYKVSVARAEAAHSVAKEKCDDKAGNVKDVCVREAKAAETRAKADARAKMEIDDSNRKARNSTTKATTRANAANAESRKDAATEKRDADYAVAREKCDAFSSEARSNCLNAANKQFGRS